MAEQLLLASFRFCEYGLSRDSIVPNRRIDVASISRLERGYHMNSLGLARSRKFWLLLIVVIVGALLGVLTQFQICEMVSPSMEPTIHQGQWLIILKHFRRPLRRDDLVWVRLDASTTTIRRIKGVPGDIIPNAKWTNQSPKIREGYYYLSGDSTNALDSKELGLFKNSQISGLVVKVVSLDPVK